MSLRAGIGWLAFVSLGVGGGAAVRGGTCMDSPEVQWAPENGGNRHFYQVRCALTDWNTANSSARTTGRHLATITSEEENDFVFELVNDEILWTNGGTQGPWLGGFQPNGSQEPAGGWTWVTGEPFSFTAWFDGEPGNTGEENHLHFFDSTGGGVLSAHWNDIGGNAMLTSITEWEHSLDIDGDGETQPLTDGLLVLRRLFGFTGPTLITGAVDMSDCTRCDAPSIEAYLGLLVAGIAHDVRQDWSDSLNPNGPWSYLHGTTALPHVASWQSTIGGYSSPQPAWAASENGNNRIPLFMKSVGAEQFIADFVAGDVVMIPRDDINGVGMGDARLRFVAPATGTYRVALAIWIGREIGRSAAWALSVDGAEQASGTVASGDAFSRAVPDGHEGSFAIGAGEQVDLLLTSLSPNGEFVGVDLRLEAFGLDVDGDGETQPLTDGLLVLRFLFGLTGAALTASAVDQIECTRCDATAITAFLETMLPGDN
jgi:hypothetical protein